MTGRPRVNVWYDVPYRSDRGYQKDGDPKKKGNVIKFFVSNLPGRCSSTDLKEVLKEFGEIEGSYIARKFDKFGKRFGFVSFRNVHDARRMEEDMKDVWMEKKQADAEKKQADVGVNDTKGGSGLGGGSGWTGTKSYCDAVENKEPTAVVETINIDANVQAFVHWYGIALLGRTVDFKTLVTLRSSLKEKGWNRVDIKYLGGFNIMLVFDKKEAAGNFLNDKEG